MSVSPMPVRQQLQKLAHARKLVLDDAKYYTQVIQSILPLIGPEAHLEFRRWGADFLAEAFASPALSMPQKEKLSLTSLDTLKSIIEQPNEDSGVIKSIVQTAASIYPLVFKWIINNPQDSTTWDSMTAIKSRILRIWDVAPPGIRVCCIKFAQRIVLAQTSGIDGDVRRGDSLEISLSMVPQNHLLIPPRNLEAEASGLLDRILGVFHENISDAVLVDATLNSLSVLIRARPTISNKILNAILSFNPLKLANSPMTSKLRVMIKSMEKTTRMLLIHVNKRDPQNPLAPRIHQHIERLMRSRVEIFDDVNRKRGLAEPTDNLDSVKRQRLGTNVSSITSNQLHIPPLAPGPHTVAELFTLNVDESVKGFDVSQMPEDLVVKIGVSILLKVDAGIFNQAINGIRERYLTLSNPQTRLLQLDPNTAPLGVDDDDDDYEPDFQLAEDTEQILNKLDTAPMDESPPISEEVTLGPFMLPLPQAMSKGDVDEVAQDAVSRLFGVMASVDETTSKRSKAGVNRLAASNNDRDAWITLITRLASRAPAGLEVSGTVKSEIDFTTGTQRLSIGDTIRETLYSYVLEDFRRRIDVAVSWLCEEWYSDRIQAKLGANACFHYEKWALRILDGIIPYLDSRDKFLTRFLGEIPSLNMDMFERIKGLCRDPAMINLALTSLLYLVMMRPPAREMALDTVEDIWRTYDDAKPIAGKYLSKWRPGSLEPAGEKKIEEAGMTTVSAAQGSSPIAA